jgi:hypothetical protein
MGREIYKRISAFACVALGLAVAGDVRLSGQTTAPEANRFEAGAGVHETHAQPGSWLPFSNTNELLPQLEPVSPPPPTRSSFMATWDAASGAKGYLLDVSTNSSFTTYVDGYRELDIGAATGRLVAGLNRGTTYYYRVRPYNAAGAGNYADVKTATTVPTVGLVIHPTFDSSITGNPNAAAIEAMINRAISFHESLFSDPITIQIRFRYSTTTPEGRPMPMGTLARTDLVLYPIPWGAYISALRADAKTSNDSQANASLPGTALSTNIRPSSAGGRAVGLDTPPAMFANGSVGQGGPYDAVITLNSSAPYQFSRPPSPGNFDAQRSTEHEVDEAIGLGSRVGDNDSNLRPQDLFSWSSPGNRNISHSGTRYFSINGGVSNIVNFNQDPDGDSGDWFSEPCPQTHPYVQNAFACAGEFSDISATSPEGINLDVIGYDLTTQTSQTSLGNISTRSFVQTGEHVMIGGFIVQGSGTKRVIIRAIGPELTQYGIPDVLANPRLELHNGNGALIGTNDDWQTTIMGGIITGSQVSDIQNSGHAPTAPSESAIIADLQAGNYTAIVHGINNTNGVALVEVYDLNPAASSSLGNISTRSFVQTGEHVMIGGFIVQGSGTKRVIIRAIGPELTQYGIPDALANPRLELHDGNGALIASNDDWQTTILGGIITSNQVSDIQNSGHAPTAASESAIIADLQPGNYTAIVRGISNTTGVALVEVYDLD